jgi:hypothetical protein
MKEFIKENNLWWMKLRLMNLEIIYY